jgi:nucleoid-associated protein YgaU
MFFKGSRYEKVADAQFTDARGRTMAYKRVRFIPDTPARFNHLVAHGDRPDLLAYRYYRDPLKFWRIADANRVLTANELVARPGDRILVPPDTQ